MHKIIGKKSRLSVGLFSLLVHLYIHLISGQKLINTEGIAQEKFQFDFGT